MDGNAFRLVLRDMSSDEVRHAMSAAESIRATGLPNYFDDQRFGSLGLSGEWIARAWCLGQWEHALWLALADPHPFDPADEKRQKQILRDLWGRWPECQQALDRSHRRSIATFLADKVNAGRDPDYRGALARIRVDLRGLYLSAYQSALWNRLLTACLKHVLPESVCQSFDLISGPAVFPLTQIADPQDIPFAALPLPSARIDEPQGATGRLLGEILAAEQIELRQLRVKYPRDSFFSKGTRVALVHPADVSAEAADDEVYAGRQRLTLEFSLPRGSYATIMVKRLTGSAEGMPHDDE
jgi:tRNA pseudouridine13 synthase